MDQAWWSARISAVAGEAQTAVSASDKRSAFEHDRARVLHSRAFRRLQHKTQVFAPLHRDFYRTRLTHSLECAQIGKALALNLWPEGGAAGVDLVEAICLAHDIGHPPFGHSGERVLNDVMPPFEGNAQTVRVLVRLEEKRRGYGLDLTRATIASVIKYPFRVAAGGKKFIYDDDAKFYPDFVVQLEDGRVLVVEYKGGHLLPGAQEKLAVGRVWQSRSKGKCLFVMPTNENFETINATVTANQ